MLFRSDKSYGIQVAKLAGVPDPVISRAKELVEELSAADISLKPRAVAAEPDMEAEQISLFDTVKDDDIITEIRDMDLGNMTPLDALNTIDVYKRQPEDLPAVAPGFPGSV